MYRIFKTVAEEENITHASKKLNISQPAVTRHIQNLEDELNVKLFERTNKGLKLTVEGKDIYNSIKEAVVILDNVSKKYASIRNISLGIHATMLNKLFSKSIAEFYNENPEITINIINEDIIDMLSALEKEQIDIVISKKLDNYNSKKIEFVSLGELHDILIVSNSSRLLNRKIDIEFLKNEIIYMPRKTSVSCQNFFNHLKLSEKEFEKVKNISYNTMLDIIRNTDGIGLVTKEYVKEELDSNTIVELNTRFKIPSIDYGIYINKNSKFKELNKFIKILKLSCNN